MWVASRRCIEAVGHPEHNRRQAVVRTRPPPPPPRSWPGPAASSFVPTCPTATAPQVSGERKPEETAPCAHRAIAQGGRCTLSTPSYCTVVVSPSGTLSNRRRLPPPPPSFNSPTAVGYTPTAIGYPPTAIGYPPTAVGCPPTAVGYPPTAVGYPATAVGYPPTAIGYPPTAVGYPPTAVGYPPTPVGYPPTAGSPPTAVAYPPTGRRTRSLSGWGIKGRETVILPGGPARRHASHASACPVPICTGRATAVPIGKRAQDGDRVVSPTACSTQSEVTNSTTGQTCA